MFNYTTFIDSIYLFQYYFIMNDCDGDCGIAPCRRSRRSEPWQSAFAQQEDAISPEVLNPTRCPSPPTAVGPTGMDLRIVRYHRDKTLTITFVGVPTHPPNCKAEL